VSGANHPSTSPRPLTGEQRRKVCGFSQIQLTVRRHHTDGGGDSDHVFALLALLGFQFAPRIPDLKNRRLYSFAKPSAYPALEPLIAGRINVALIRAHWSEIRKFSEILRIATSIRTGTVTASLIMRQLASYPGRTALPRRCANWACWSAPFLRSIGSKTPSCAATRAASSTRWDIPAGLAGPVCTAA
jgi:hypothetical protein